MKKVLTSLFALHNVIGQLGGPIIYTISFEDDHYWCKKNTQYLFVEQKVNLDQEVYLHHI